MKRRCFMVLVWVVALVLFVPIVMASSCGGEDGGDAAMMKKLPDNAAKFQFTDVAAMRNDGDFKDAYDNWKESVGSLIDELGISTNDVEGNGWTESVGILEGSFDLEDVETKLDREGYDNGKHNEVTTYESSVNSFGLVSESCIVWSRSLDDVEGCIDVIKGKADSLSTDKDFSDMLGKLPGGVRVGVFAGGSYEDLEMWGGSYVKKDSETASYSAVFLFEGDDAAEAARDEIRADWKGNPYYNGVEVTQDGEYLIATAEVDIEDL